jgi:hypothetical protein
MKYGVPLSGTEHNQNKLVQIKIAFRFRIHLKCSDQNRPLMIQTRPLRSETGQRILTRTAARLSLWLPWSSLALQPSYGKNLFKFNWLW